MLTFRALALCRSESERIPSDEGLTPSKRQHSNLFTAANLPLGINSVDKPNKGKSSLSESSEREIKKSFVEGKKGCPRVMEDMNSATQMQLHKGA